MTNLGRILLAYSLWLLVGIGLCGVHRIYLGHFWLGIFMMVTFGFLGLGQLVDLFLLPRMLARAFPGIFVDLNATATRASPTAYGDQVTYGGESFPRQKSSYPLNVLLREAEASMTRVNKQRGS